MSKTQLTTQQLGISSVNRDDLDTTTTSKAIVAKLIAGTNITLGSTGVDAGTGDVTINATGGLVIGTTAITSGTTTRILYDNAGILGEYTITGTGTVVAMQTSPTFVTPLLGTPTSGVLTNTTGYLLNNIAAATGTNNIDNLNYGQGWNWTTKSSGSAMSLIINSIAAAAGSQTVLSVSNQGVNSNAGQTTYGLSVDNLHSGTGSINIAANFFATSGASANIAAQFSAVGTGAYAILVPASSGSVGLGTSTPTSLLHVVSVPTTGIGAAFSSATVTTGDVVQITSTSTVSNASSLLNIQSAAVNGTASKTTTGLTVNVANTGTTPVNNAINIVAGALTLNGSAGTSGQVLTSAGANALPTWTTNGAGTVTSVSFTGGLISVANPTTTPALTVAGTSGGIPYFSSTSTWASSALLAANALMIGGGAGVAPSTTTTGTGILTWLGTPSSANLRGALTDENGTGAALFDAATTPTFTTGFRIGGAAASRKMIVGDGTNFVPSTETWATPGTSGNVLTSDGTNWISSAATGGGTSVISGKTIWVDKDSPNATDTRGILDRHDMSVPYVTIQAALTDWVDGDTIIILPGAYSETISQSITGKLKIIFMNMSNDSTITLTGDDATGTTLDMHMINSSFTTSSGNTFEVSNFQNVYMHGNTRPALDGIHVAGITQIGSKGDTISFTNNNTGDITAYSILLENLYIENDPAGTYYNIHGTGSNLTTLNINNCYISRATPVDGDGDRVAIFFEDGVILNLSNSIVYNPNGTVNTIVWNSAFLTKYINFINSYIEANSGYIVFAGDLDNDSTPGVIAGCRIKNPNTEATLFSWTNGDSFDYNFYMYDTIIQANSATAIFNMPDSGASVVDFYRNRSSVLLLVTPSTITYNDYTNLIDASTKAFKLY